MTSLYRTVSQLLANERDPKLDILRRAEIFDVTGAVQAFDENFVIEMQGDPTIVKIVPPYNHMWVEWSVDMLAVVQSPKLQDVATTLFPDIDKLLNQYAAEEQAINIGVLMSTTHDDDSGWYMSAEIFFGDNETGGDFIRFQANKDGFLIPESAPPLMTTIKAGDALFDSSFTSVVFTNLIFSLGLIHCKNVQVRDVEPVSGKRVSGGKRRKATLRGQPNRKYHILTIRPIRVEKVGGRGQQHGQVSLHFARGHFKTYKGDAPLFGKYTGTYWWSPQIRGNQNVGTVDKDYRVQP